MLKDQQPLVFLELSDHFLGVGEESLNTQVPVTTSGVAELCGKMDANVKDNAILRVVVPVT